MKAASQTGMRLLERGAKPDDRKRLALGKILKGYDEHAVFDVYEDEHGRIVLDPQVTIPAREAWLFKDKKALASVRRGLAQLGIAKPRDLGSFAAHADHEA